MLDTILGISLLVGAYNLGKRNGNKYQTTFADIFSNPRDIPNEYKNLTIKEKYELSKKLFEDYNDLDSLILSLSLLKDSADKGYHIAQYQLGNLLISGDILNPNYEEGYKYLLLASNSGILEATWDLAYLYQNGLYVTKNLKKAYNLYLSLANQGVVEAMTQIGLANLSGAFDNEINEEVAIKYLQQAAEHDNIPALIALGTYYYNIEEDEESYHFLSRASRLGSSEADELLEDEVYDQYRD